MSTASTLNYQMHQARGPFRKALALLHFNTTLNWNYADI